MCNASCFLTPVLQGKHKQMKECLHPALPGTHGLVSLPTGLFQSRFPSALIQTVVHKHRQLHATFRSQRQGSRFSGEGQGVIRGEQQKVPTATLWLCLGGLFPGPLAAWARREAVGRTTLTKNSPGTAAVWDHWTPLPTHSLFIFPRAGKQAGQRGTG